VIDIDHLYFEWLMTQLDSEGVREGVAYMSGLLWAFDFERRVGNDINRAEDGMNLRRAFMANFEEVDFDPHVTNEFMMMECNWLEMLIALATHLDYLYDGGVEGRFLELTGNMGLDVLLRPEVDRSPMLEEYDQRMVDIVTNRIDNNRFDRHGRGGLFPLQPSLAHPDQRRVEIWDQHAAYFRERLEGVLWTSTN
jgi:hypothetical protein